MKTDSDNKMPQTSHAQVPARTRGEQSSFTPGPWSCPKGLEVVSANGRGITYIDEGDYREPTEAEANARLIAAAPELLEALKLMLECKECEEGERDNCRASWGAACREALIAIAKTEGAEGQ